MYPSTTAYFNHQFIWALVAVTTWWPAWPYFTITIAVSSVSAIANVRDKKSWFKQQEEEEERFYSQKSPTQCARQSKYPGTMSQPSMPIGIRHLKREKKKRDTKRVSRTVKIMPMSMRVWLRSAARYSGFDLERSMPAMVAFLCSVRIGSDQRYIEVGES